MAIPDFQSLMLPILEFASDQQEHSMRETYDALAQRFKVTAVERQELLPSGRQATFDNRVGWAKTYLVKTRLLESTGRGTYRITKRGMEVLQKRPDRIDLKYLSQYSELEQFRQGRNSKQQESLLDEPDISSESTLNPEEQFEGSYQLIRKQLAKDILERVLSCSPRFFESLVVDLLIAMGYGGSRKDAGEAVGGSGDGGIDGIIKEDKLGLDFVYIQAKLWDPGNPVGSRALRDFVGSLESKRANKGVFITTSRFTPDAEKYVNQIGKKIVLIDGDMLAQLMIEFGVGVSQVATYQICQLDNDYFED